MQRRLARRGRNAGGYFWGCTGYPSCRGVVSDEPPAPQQALENANVALTAVPVSWSDATLDRPGWSCRYSFAGGSLRSFPAATATRASSCWIARNRVGEPPDPADVLVSAVFRKLLQRGRAPAIHPTSEDRLLVQSGHLESTTPSTISGDLARYWRRATESPDFSGDHAVDLTAPLDSGLHFDSFEERRFFLELLPSIAASAARWTLPQASLDALVASDMGSPGQRRVDFLVSRPNMSALVIEIDGIQHRESRPVDADRDRTLLHAGIDTLRVPATEIRDGAGPMLDRIGQLLAAPDVPPLSDDARYLAYGPAQIQRFALALGELLEGGLLRADAVRIALSDDLGLPLEVFAPYIELLSAVSALWGTDATLPAWLGLSDGENSLAFSLVDGLYRLTGAEPQVLWEDVQIVLEFARTPVQQLPDATVSAVVVRSTALPVLPLDPLFEGAARPVIPVDTPFVRAALLSILVAIFAKASFREGQLDAIVELLSGRDCTVLLPTGAGKSLVYQLSGLVMPGRTLVIDPLISLIEDQVEGLRRIGIDRTAVFSSFQTQRGLSGESLRSTASGEALFIFLAPERLQQSSFRQAVRTLAYSSTINLAVVDEAHCVSEWGHDFRTAYLRLGRVLRDVCRDTTGTPPPLVALTGTASRAVLRDVLLELGIERRSENSVIRPESFDRPELRFSVLRVPPPESAASLIGLLRTLPSRLGISMTDAFRSRGVDTTSGIVFVPHVNGDFGVMKVAASIAGAIGGSPVVYAGSAPREASNGDWELAKRRNTDAFKENRAPLLVSTKAFGMGIDKPNVRYVIHYGLPSSIEAFYQEAGRAGRDRRPAECAIVLVEQDERRDRELLEERTPLEQSRNQYENVSRSEQDDVTRQLFFHFNSFEGVLAETSAVAEMLGQLGDVSDRRRVEIPFGGSDGDRSAREKALHRLVVLDVVRDYLVEWGSRKFIVELSGASSRSVIDALVGYIARYNRQRGAREAEQSEALSALDLNATILACAERLVRFTYDTIELSRRRSLLEVWLAARDSAGGGASVLRERVLAYLTEGDISPAMVELLEAPTLELSDWLGVADRVADDDEAREMRGSAARLLESYPDHPGLLFARAWSELLDTRGDMQVVSADLRAALANAIGKYAIPPETVGRFVDLLFEAANSAGRPRATAIAACAIEANVPSTAVDRLLDESLENSGPPGLLVLALNRELHGALEIIGAVAR